MQYPTQFAEEHQRSVPGITLHMLEDFCESGLNVTTDRWYTSPLLAIELIKRKITLLGTLQIARA